MFVRVQCRTTGHQYDVWETAVRPKAHKVLKGYPPSSRARPQKYRTDKAGKPTRRSPQSSDGGTDGLGAMNNQE